MPRLLLIILLLGWLATPVRADEQVRQTQEELRRRNLYFGDIDGHFSPDVANALRRYQKRKGFAVTGTIDAETATSLNVSATDVAAAPPQPDEPILRSDIARQLSEAERIALEKSAEDNPDLPPSPSPPAEQPAPSQDIAPDRIRSFIEGYLRDGQSDDIPAQTRYFSYPVDYFVHGLQGPAFVEKDVREYVKRWPERNYILMQPIIFRASEREGETVVEFPIAYNLRRPNHTAKGQTKNLWVVRTEGDELKIVAIHEQRVRP
ncbi:MAG: peptidoglycan-binding protein, partial [Verrucomicrobiota bacterium]|nr:peptidoglycan-binding protein [Verrucomicrobiota bacterium]